MKLNSVCRMKRRPVLCALLITVTFGSDHCRMWAADYSGRITDNSVGVGGLRVHWTSTGPLGGTDSGDAPASSSSGNWASQDWPLGTSIRFSLSQAGYSFSPAYYDVNTGPVGNASRSDLNFVRSSSISGKVMLANGTAVSGVTVTRGAASDATDGSGNYSFSLLGQGTYMLTPSKSGLTFRPANLAVTVGPSKSGQNFIVANPMATTLVASNVIFGGARLNGSVTGEGTLPSRVSFEYGTAGSFSLATSEQILPTNVNAVTVNSVVTNLGGGLNYNYRCVAANDNGTN